MLQRDKTGTAAPGGLHRRRRHLLLAALQYLALFTVTFIVLYFIF